MESCFTVLVLSALNPHCWIHIHNPRLKVMCICLCKHTHKKKYTLRRTNLSVLTKKTFRRSERELVEAAPFSFLCKSPSHTIYSRQHVSSSLISVKTRHSISVCPSCAHRHQTCHTPLLLAPAVCWQRQNDTFSRIQIFLKLSYSHSSVKAPIPLDWHICILKQINLKRTNLRKKFKLRQKYWAWLR